MRTVARFAIVVLVLASCHASEPEASKGHHQSGRPERHRSSDETTVTTEATPPPASPALHSDAFQTPSGNIKCFFGQHTLTCDLLSWDSPPPSRCVDAPLWGMTAPAYGGVWPNCYAHLDYSPPSTTLEYGQRWARGTLSCDSEKTGVTCSNATGDGFFLSRAEWRITRSTSGQPLRSEVFRMPSRNIYCMRFKDALRCDVLSGLVPEPSGDCELDWTGMFLVASSRRVGPECAGDTVAQSDAPVLNYDTEWTGNGLSCDSHESGLVCWNSWGRGFTLSSEEWRTF
jgi:Family of unknown function (DUF6636)